MSNEKPWDILNQTYYLKESRGTKCKIVMADKMMTVNKIPYYFYEDGVIASDETFLMYDIVEGEDVSYTMYSFQYGRLVKNC